MRLVIAPKYEHMREWISTLPSTFSQSGEVIYDARNQIRVIETPWGTMNVKRYRRPIFINRIIYTLFRPAKAIRAFENAHRLQQFHIPTPEAVAYIIEYKMGLITDSYLITVQSPLKRKLYEFREHGIEGYEPIIQALARFTAQLHEQGIYHRDFSPGNILFDSIQGKIQFSLVDINRMDFYQKPVPSKRAFQNFARLWGEEDFFTLLADTYAEARGWDKQTCEREIIYYWKLFWKYRK